MFFFIFVNIAAYDVFDWRDYRVISPVLFGCILFLILNDKQIVATTSLVFCIIGMVILFLSPQVLDSFNKGRYDKLVLNPVLNKIEYTSDAVSIFENTVVVQQFNTNTVLNIPAGIGITCSEVLSDRLRSRYIFSNKELQLQTYKLIDSNKTGYLYQKQIPKNKIQ